MGNENKRSAIDLHGRSLEIKAFLYEAIKTDNVEQVQGVCGILSTGGFNVADAMDVLCVIVEGHSYRPLHIAALHGSHNVALFLLQTMNASIDIRSSLGWTPLLVAASMGNIDTVKLLVDNGANTNAVDDGNEKTIMGFVSHYKTDIQDELVSYLLDNGLSLNLQDSEGHTPFLFACTKCTISTVRRMLSMGADIHPQNSRGGSALHFAAALNDDPRVIQLLIDQGGQVNQRAVLGGYTPLHWANSVAIAKVLLENGASLFLRDNQGKNPAQWNGRNNPDVLAYLQFVQNFCTIRDGWMKALNPNDGLAFRRRADTLIRQQQDRLLLLRHASKCKQGPNCSSKLCGQFAILWQHMKTCANKECTVPDCHSSRCLLNHHGLCKANGMAQTCEICGPVLLEISKQVDDPVYVTDSSGSEDDVSRDTAQSPCEAAGQIGNSTSTSGGNVSDKLLRKKQDRLFLLRHASRCKQGANCTTKFCGRFSVLWQHMKTCADRKCTVRHCPSSRCLLNHHRLCKANGKAQTCEICGPFLLKVKEQKKDEVCAMDSRGSPEEDDSGDGAQKRDVEEAHTDTDTDTSNAGGGSGAIQRCQIEQKASDKAGHTGLLLLSKAVHRMIHDGPSYQYQNDVADAFVCVPTGTWLNEDEKHRKRQSVELGLGAATVKKSKRSRIT